jgi:hypothetical protein
LILAALLQGLLREHFRQEALLLPYKYGMTPSIYQRRPEEWEALWPDARVVCPFEEMQGIGSQYLRAGVGAGLRGLWEEGRRVADRAFEVSCE